MPTLTLLGTGAAFSDAHRTTTMLAFSDEGSTLLVDCGGDVIQRMLAAKLPLESLRGLIITHEHADHVSGFPLFLERIWVGGRREPIPIYGIRPALDQARRCWDAFDTRTWQGVPERRWVEVAYEEGAPVLEDALWRITAAPVVHPVPIIGLRVEHKPTGKVVAYSADTEPCEAFERLAQGADLVVHEANGSFKGHTAAADAAGIARRAGAGRLLLVHLPPAADEAYLAPARAVFEGAALGEELGVYPY